MKSSAGMTRIEALIILVVLGFVLMLLFPSVSSPLGSTPKSQAKNDVTQIATAVTAYQTEYGHLPAMPTNGLVSGDLLSALVGSNQTLNPRRIVFIDVGIPKQGQKGGLRDGTFVDPWGGPYRIAIATATNNYASVTAGTNQVSLRKKVAVWNDPSSHPRTFWSDDKARPRRYVTSWD